MNKAIDNIICIECGDELGEMTRQKISWLTCHGCGQCYPYVSEQIPVLVKNPNIYLASLYLQHNRYLQRQNERTSTLSIAARESPQRLEILFLIAQGLKENSQLVESVSKELAKYLSIDDIAQAIKMPQFIGYTNVFEYLERDWCNLIAGEEELAIVRDSLFKQFDLYLSDSANVLVLGAGTGRTASDIQERFEHVYALDISLTMAQCFYKVLSQGISFSAVNTTCMFNSIDMVKNRNACPDANGSSRCANTNGLGLNYIVGDACRIPLASRSMSAVVSNYFTDVMPLKDYFSEIKRVLKSGGLFLHFGPLAYHFDDISQHLSAEQIRQSFEKNGFKVCSDESITGKHLFNKGSMAHQMFDNWIFAASLI